MKIGNQRGLQRIVYLIVIVVVITIIFLSLYQYRSPAVLTTIAMAGNSMEPTIMGGQTITVDNSYYNYNPLSRGDIVAFRLKTQNTSLVKRIIALPGDFMEFPEGKIMINGRIIEEDYTIEDSGDQDVSIEDLELIADMFGQDGTDIGDIINQDQNTSGRFDMIIRMLNQDGSIPQNYVIALNDNRKNIYDSRHLGLFPIDYITGKVIL